MTEPTRSQHARASVDPTVNVYAGDAPFFEATYRASGSIADKRAAASLEPPREHDLDDQLARLLVDQVVDMVENVNWSVAAIERVMTRYYGDPAAPTHCEHETAIFQYLSSGRSTSAMPTTCSTTTPTSSCISKMEAHGSTSASTSCEPTRH
jgi:hypothetical protein